MAGRRTGPSERRGANTPDRPPSGPSDRAHAALPQALRHPRACIYGWIVAGVTFSSSGRRGVVRATPGVLIVPWEREFGWSTATISGGIALTIFLYGMIGPFAVAIIERFGLRRAVCTTLVVLAVGTAATVFMRQVWQMVLLWGLVVGAGTGMVANVLGATVSRRGWFGRHRSLVVGLLTASAATASRLLPFSPTFRRSGLAGGGAHGRARRARPVPLVAWLMRDRRTTGRSRPGPLRETRSSRHRGVGSIRPGARCRASPRGCAHGISGSCRAPSSSAAPRPTASSAPT